MKYLNYAFVAVIAIASIAALIVFLMNRTPAPDTVACTMDAQICPDGSAVGRVAPSCEFAPCPGAASTTGGISADTQAEIDAHQDLIVLSSPRPGERITSPVILAGTARGYWFFEGSFPVSIVNWDGLIIGEGVATAVGEWMTEDFVPFTATINFSFDPATPYDRGAIILRKDNPSGLPEHDDALEVPVVF